MSGYVDHRNRHLAGGSDPVLGPTPAAFVDRALTAQTITDNTVTFVSFDTVYYDSDDWVDLGVSATNLNVPFDGMYVVNAYVRWVGAAGAGTRRYVAIQQNVVSGVVPVGIISANECPNVAGVGPDQSTTYLGPLLEGQSLSLKVLQNSGGNLNLAFGQLSVALVSDYTP